MSFEFISRAAIGIGIMIVLDVVAGITAAASNGDIDSKKLRQGLMHKLGLVIAFALSVALEYECSILPLDITVPLVAPISVYIVFMEACSVYENITQINPDFRPEKLEDLFRNTPKGRDNNNE